MRLYRAPALSALKAIKRGSNPHPQHSNHLPHHHYSSNVTTHLYPSVRVCASVGTRCFSTLAATSNHARGTAFEHLAIKALTSDLPHLRLSLQHRGGAGDQGVDFQGTWTLTQTGTHSHDQPSSVSSSSFYRILGQCKMENKAMGPLHVRALEGTLSQYQQQQPSSIIIIGMLISSQRYTIAAENQWRRSALPMLLITFDADTETETLTLVRFSLNPSAQRLLPELRVTRDEQQGLSISINPIKQQQQVETTG